MEWEREVKNNSERRKAENKIRGKEAGEEKNGVDGWMTSDGDFCNPEHLITPDYNYLLYIYVTTHIMFCFRLPDTNILCIAVFFCLL